MITYRFFIKLVLSILFGIVLHFSSIPSNNDPGNEEEPQESPFVVTPQHPQNSNVKVEEWITIKDDENLKFYAEKIIDFYNILESMSNMSSDANLHIGKIYQNYEKILGNIADMKRLKVGFPVPYEKFPTKLNGRMDRANDILSKLVGNGNKYRPARKKNFEIDINEITFQVDAREGGYYFVVAHVPIHWKEFDKSRKEQQVMLYIHRDPVECKIRLISQLSVGT